MKASFVLVKERSNLLKHLSTSSAAAGEAATEDTDCREFRFVGVFINFGSLWTFLEVEEVGFTHEAL